MPKRWDVNEELTPHFADLIVGSVNGFVEMAACVFFEELPSLLPGQVSWLVAHLNSVDDDKEHGFTGLALRPYHSMVVELEETRLNYARDISVSMGMSNELLHERLKARSG